jgi:hypothetical protein
VVIVNPDGIPVMKLWNDYFGEKEVNVIVGIPGSLVNTTHFM